MIQHCVFIFTKYLDIYDYFGYRLYKQWNTQNVYNWKTQKQSASIMLIIIMARGYKCREQTPIMKENSAQQQKNGEHDLRILIVAWAPPSSANIAQNSSNRTQILSFHIFFSHIFQHSLLFSSYFLNISQHFLSPDSPDVAWTPACKLTTTRW